MTGFAPWTSSIRSNLSANYATTNTQKAPKYLGYFGKKLSPRPFKNSPIWSHCAHRGPKVLSEVK